MKQILLHQRKPQLFDVPVPLLHETSVRVQTLYSFISSGTEYATMQAASKSLLSKFASHVASNTEKLIQTVKDHGVAGTHALIKEKHAQYQPIGYSCTGRVIEVGSGVEGLRVGDYVACAGSDVAFHAEIVVVPQNLCVKISDPSVLKHASITTIGAIALQGVRRAQVQLGERVCIIGLGLIGQLTVQLAKLSGAYVIGVDIDNEKRALAASFKADITFNSKETDIIQDILFHTAHRGVDTTIITASAATGDIINQAMRITRRKGKVILVGDVKLDFDREHFYSKEIDLLISCSYGPGRYDSSYEQQGIDYPYAYVRWTENRNMQLFVELIEQGKISIDPLISNEFQFHNAQDAYDALQQKRAIGIVMKYDAEIGTTALKTLVNRLSSYSSSNVINLGVIGIGGFCKTKLLPLIAAESTVEIKGFADVNTPALLTLGKVYDVAEITSDYQMLIQNSAINTIVIATPHAHHAQQTIDALNAGKFVFVEKPAAVTLEQWERIKRTAEDTQSIYCVDFNRSFSPFMERVKEAVSQRANPLMIHYRMNAGFIPKDYWIQSAVHKGRIIGEACHIFDLFAYLTDSYPLSVDVAALTPRTSDLCANDNVSIHVQMADGSVCSLLYTAVGNSKAGKESMELFFDGKTIIMNDYIHLKGYGLSSSFDYSTRVAEKGHKELLHLFFKAVREGLSSPIPLARIDSTTRLSIIADQLAREGGGRCIL